MTTDETTTKAAIDGNTLLAEVNLRVNDVYSFRYNEVVQAIIIRKGKVINNG